MAHTPGPWAYSHRKGPHGNYNTEVFDVDGKTIATLAWYAIHDGRRTFTNREDNARLVAAAPMLLASLKETREAAAALMRAIRDAGVIAEVMAHMPNTFDGFGKRADEAIDEAEGR